MTSGAPVLKVNVAGKMTPTDSLVPLAVVMAWLMHLPSKKNIGFGVDGHAIDGLGRHRKGRLLTTESNNWAAKTKMKN